MRPPAVTSLLETLWAMGQDIVLQEYVRESKGRDIRAIVVGARVVGAVGVSGMQSSQDSQVAEAGLAAFRPE